MTSRRSRECRDLALKRRVHDVDVRGKPEHLADDVVRGPAAKASVVFVQLASPAPYKRVVVLSVTCVNGVPHGTISYDD